MNYIKLESTPVVCYWNTQSDNTKNVVKSVCIRELRLLIIQKKWKSIEQELLSPLC